MSAEIVLKQTWSLCAVCMNRIPAKLIRRNNEVFLRKECNLHGVSETIIWRGFFDFSEWGGASADPDDGNANCPDECGLCSSHLRDTCCVIFNVTERCNLNCNFCFADSRPSGDEPSLEDVSKSLKDIIIPKKTFLQLSGGEPTLRDDLPQIIRRAAELGAKFIQLNTNGLRIAADKQYTKELADAGLTFVFLQFDGTEDIIHKRIRNKTLRTIKQKAIDHCAEFNVGVTLVPTLVKGINTYNIGELIRFAIGQSPKVRGIHFQPATFIGRYSEQPLNENRLTLDELIHEIQFQSDNMVKPKNLLPSCCDHPLCGFHGDFVVNDGKLFPLLTKKQGTTPGCCGTSLSEKNREFIGRRWKRTITSEEPMTRSGADIHDMESFLRQVSTHGFTVTAMAFQDAWNLDLSRLRRCSLHVYDKDRMFPFCSYYISSWNKR